MHDETAFERRSTVEIGLALVSFALGFVALALAETAAAEVLLAVFMASNPAWCGPSS